MQEKVITVTEDSLAPEHPVYLFRELFTKLHPDQEMALERVYAADIVFEDPLHRVEGLAQLQRYFARLNANLASCRFEFAEGLVGQGSAILPWTLHLSLRQRPRRLITVPGASWIRFERKVHSQRDYFDAGALIYEQVPVLGPLIRWIKSKV
jgi:hypothetical protein